MAIGAHPDDCEIHAGGMLCKYAADATCLVLSQTDADRRAEADKAAAELGLAQPVYANLSKEDMNIPRKIIEVIEEILAASGAEVVLTHHYADSHQDHHAVYRATVAACRERAVTLLLYEPTYSGGITAETFRPQWFEAITAEQLEAKKRAIACHRSQRPERWIKRVAAAAAYWGPEACTGLAEAFEMVKVAAGHGAAQRRERDSACLAALPARRNETGYRKESPVRIAHFAPFAPNGSGMYETARDMIVAERMQGYTAEMVDVGAVEVDRKPEKGLVDRRGGQEIRTLAYNDVVDFDLFVVNRNIPDGFVARTKAPLIQVMHGQPANTFHMSRTGGLDVVELYLQRARSERWKVFLTLWREYLPYWQTVIPNAKLHATPFPPCDLERYTPSGPVHEFKSEGMGEKFNILISDIERLDTRNGKLFYLAHGAMLAAKHVPGLKVHFYGLQKPLGPWKYIFGRMKQMGILGERFGMMFNFDQVLRGADLVLSSREMATRIIRESLACGTPVVAARCNRHVPETFTCIPEDAGSIMRAIVRAYRAIKKEPDKVWNNVRHAAHCFNLQDFGQELKGLYEEVA